ncbi:hypothetical protein KHA94_22110 [Bacillus sp. FJAT-49705]|uniref:Uncharacterized protein n=1 Tax=Cytobacillus citreus TaxID=2833586 RepID=A0ABS5P0R9_9BACI|nr:hypothetical protein [Cytobacillus citreus]MBS4192829.1 hypothetical protein [Cytobacillus citreus]
MLQNHFVIETERESIIFENRPDGFYLKGQRVLDIFSITEKLKNFSIEEATSSNQLTGELNVSMDYIYLN